MSARLASGWKPSGAKPIRRSWATLRTWAKWVSISALVSCSVSTGAPDSSSWPAGSSEIAAPPCFRPMMLPWSVIGRGVVALQPGQQVADRRRAGRRRAGRAAAPGRPGGSRTSRAPCRCASRPRGLQPAAMWSASWRIEVIGVASPSPGLDMRFPDVSGFRTSVLAAPRGLQQCQPGDAGGLGPQDARTEAHRRYKGMPEHGVKLRRREAAFGADQQGGGAGGGAAAGRRRVRSMAA